MHSTKCEVVDILAVWDINNPSNYYLIDLASHSTLDTNYQINDHDLVINYVLMSSHAHQIVYTWYTLQRLFSLLAKMLSNTHPIG